MIKLGEKIKSLRKQKNISQEVLANYLGVSFQAVSKWETEAALPDVTLIPAIAAFFVFNHILLHMHTMRKAAGCVFFSDLAVERKNFNPLIHGILIDLFHIVALGL